ncbi:MAG: ABC transporter ATP-binding protein/permease [Oscillospiraceae bacterium]|nr:ABC transporter ATP-binding protein/permease [Oscillospiraceae bacterium]
MMINKRLISMVSDSRKYIACNVAASWCSLIANFIMLAGICRFFSQLYEGNTDSLLLTAVVVSAAVIVRYICTLTASEMSFLSSDKVKKILRGKIYSKLLSIGASYRDKISTSEAVQVAVEGVDQLETYFGSYLPQFFYAMLAPVTLFVLLCFVNVPAAIVLLVCVPLIPVSIAAVQTWAKKLLSKYWGQYTALGDTFLENLQGLTTLKIYKADKFKNDEMNAQSEKFRKITMKVLTMQLNSITIMDLIAYGGAALGMIVAISQSAKSALSLEGCLLIILVSADFFIPMRQLGSFFHIAMNGMAASEKIFRLLDIPEEPQKNMLQCPADGAIVCSRLGYSYDSERIIINNVDITFRQGSLTAIVGESGCGKSTIASVLMGTNKGYTGSVTIGGMELSQIEESSLMKNMTYISHKSYLFKGTVRENLLMGRPSAGDDEMWEVLRRVKLADFLAGGNGLDTELSERASNLSGGQCQRLALARALLHDSPVYIFDEATSNIDVESENDIMDEIYRLAEYKTVILISHRLANAEASDNIYVLEGGKVAESGTHRTLLSINGVYSRLLCAQKELENFEVQEG